MGTNRDDIMAALSPDWQTTSEVIGKLPRLGRAQRSMDSMARTCLLKMWRDGDIERGDIQGISVWRKPRGDGQ